MYYAISNKDTDLLKTGKNGKKTFRLLVLCIKIKFTIACSLISLIKKICIELWVNKCTTSLFWNIRTCFIHVNTGTPSLLVLGYSWNTWWHKLSTDASFRLKMLSSLFADEKISQLSPEFESGLNVLVGSNWKPETSIFSISKTLSRSSSEI